MNEVNVGRVPFTERHVRGYLLTALTYWREVQARAERENVRPHPNYDGAKERADIAGVYVDAYQSMLNALFPEAEAQPVQEEPASRSEPESEPDPAPLHHSAPVHHDHSPSPTPDFVGGGGLFGGGGASGGWGGGSGGGGADFSDVQSGGSSTAPGSK
jgi:hypothetical protein